MWLRMSKLPKPSAPWGHCRLGGVHQGKAGIELGIIPPCFDFFSSLVITAPPLHSLPVPATVTITPKGSGSKSMTPGRAQKSSQMSPVVPGSQRYRLAAVHHTAAADGEDHIHSVLRASLAPSCTLA